MTRSWLMTLAVVTLWGCGAETTPINDPSGRVVRVMALTGSAAAGNSVYANNCAACHGTSGEGSGEFPALKGNFKTRTKEALAALILNGQGQMPALPTLTDQQVADVIAFGNSTF